MALMGTANHMFGQHLEDHGIFPDDGLITRPWNWREISGMIMQARPVPIPSGSYATQYQEFRRIIKETVNEQDVMRKIFPLIEGKHDCYTSGGSEFSNLEDLTDGNIVKASPDVYDGQYPCKIEQDILKELGSFIAPLGDRKHPVVPNFFAELKGPRSDRDIAEQQARYAGANGARAIHELRSFLAEDPDTIFDNSAYTITATYFSETLRLYAHNPVKPSVPGGPITYRMTLMVSLAMDGGPFYFQQAVVAFRNAREWAKTKRDKFIAEANARKRNLADT